MDGTPPGRSRSSVHGGAVRGGCPRLGGTFGDGATHRASRVPQSFRPRCMTRILSVNEGLRRERKRLGERLDWSLGADWNAATVFRRVDGGSSGPGEWTYAEI